MLLAAIMAMVLAAAAPAFAQATATTDDSAGDTQYNQGQQNDQNTVVQDSICVNVQQAATNQYQGGDQAAAAGGALPATGGSSLLALGAGALLVAGGLLARRIVR